MSYLDSLAPKLTVRKTLSHPADEEETGRVLGFTARNTLLGHDALVLKAEELPTIRDAPAVTHYIVPDEQADAAIAEDIHVYILEEHTVRHIDPIDVSKGVAHSGTKYGQSVTGQKVSVEKMKKWPRSRVEVSN